MLKSEARMALNIRKTVRSGIRHPCRRRLVSGAASFVMASKLLPRLTMGPFELQPQETEVSVCDDAVQSFTIPISCYSGNGLPLVSGANQINSMPSR